MKEKLGVAKPRDLRNFGLIVGGLFGMIGLWPMLWDGASMRWWALGLSAVLAVPALVAPTALRPVYALWMRLGAVLGWFNTRLILGLSFYGLLMPIGMVMRLSGRDPLRRTFDKELETYRVDKAPRPGEHMRNPF